MKKFLFLSILCYACNVVYGQHYIPVKKMISNYKEQKAIDTLKNILKQEYLWNNLYYNPTYKDQKIFVRNGALNILQDKRLCYT